MEEYKLIDKLFEFREEEGIKNIQKDMFFLKNRVKGIKRKEIENLICNIPQESKVKLLNNIDNLIADYNIMLAYYNKKYYIQGFEDALEIERKCK